MSETGDCRQPAQHSWADDFDALDRMVACFIDAAAVQPGERLPSKVTLFDFMMWCARQRDLQKSNIVPAPPPASVRSTGIDLRGAEQRRRDAPAMNGLQRIINDNIRADLKAERARQERVLAQVHAPGCPGVPSCKPKAPWTLCGRLRARLREAFGVATT